VSVFLYDLNDENYAIVRHPSKKKKRTDLCRNTKPALDHQPSEERLTIMTTHTSAIAHEEAPHLTGLTVASIVLCKRSFVV
jgi:hypothetical protein